MLLTVDYQPCHRVFSHLSDIASRPGIKVITYDHEGIFNNAETNISELKQFVLSRSNMNYPIYVDVKRVAINGEQNALVPNSETEMMRMVSTLQAGQKHLGTFG